MLYNFKKVKHCVMRHCLKGLEIFEKSSKIEVGIPFSIKIEKVIFIGLSSIEKRVSTAPD